MLPEPESSEVHRDDIFSYAFGGPAATGVIKTRPEDFVVCEELDYPLSGAGEHICLKIRKTNANTGWVAAELARYPGVRPMDIGYAGRKDRYAITEQWFSCYLPGTEFSFADCHIPGVQILEETRHAKKIRKGDVKWNHFDITVRSPGVDGHRDALEATLGALQSRGFPNYFGNQRFGRDGENLKKADAMLRDGKRIRKHRDIYLSAARAWLFNHYLSDQVANNRWESGSGPLFGKSRDPHAGEENLDDISTAWIAGLRRLGLKADTRPLAVIPHLLEWSFGEDVVGLRFSLPAGSFATSLLRELFVVTDASVLGAEDDE